MTSIDIRCPPSASLKAFLEVFEKLSIFESQQRYIRQYGAYSNAEIKAVSDRCKPVLDWLKELSAALEKEGG